MFIQNSALTTRVLDDLTSRQRSEAANVNNA